MIDGIWLLFAWVPVGLGCYAFGYWWCERFYARHGVTITSLTKENQQLREENIKLKRSFEVGDDR